MYHGNMRKRGFTLIELLIVISIVAILSVLAIFVLTNNLGKSRDGKRKADLNRLKTAFEEYYVDKNEYPSADVLSDCGGFGLRPYITAIPCDPKTKKPYCYIYDTDGGGQNYKVLSNLENKYDPIISQLDCDDDPDYCGYEDECSTLGNRFNYGVSSSNILVNREAMGGGSLGTPTPTPSASPSSVPLPSSVPGNFACTPQGSCDGYSSPYAAPHYCPITFNAGGAGSQCAIYCASSGSARCAD